MDFAENNVPQLNASNVRETELQDNASQLSQIYHLIPQSFSTYFETQHVTPN